MLDERVKKIAVAVEPDVARVRERLSANIAGHDAVSVGEDGLVLFRRGRGVVHRARVELLAHWAPELGLMRWGWAGRGANLQEKSRVDGAFREAQRYGLAQIACDQITLEDEPDVQTIVDVASTFIACEGVLRHVEGTRIIFYALFDGQPGDVAPDPRGRGGSQPASQFPPGHFRPAVVGDARGVNPYTGSSSAPSSPASMRRPSAMPRSLAEPVAPVELSRDPMSVAAPAEIGSVFTHEPAYTAIPGATAMPPPVTPAAGPIREPSRATFFPLAQMALAQVANSCPGFKQALLVLALEMRDTKWRYYVHFVASDAHGDLVSLEVTRELFEIAGKMIADDAREGNGRWKRLTARLRATAKGASVDVEVKA